jgi:hypothetical protein
MHTDLVSETFLHRVLRAPTANHVIFLGIVGGLSLVSEPAFWSGFEAQVTVHRCKSYGGSTLR